MSVLRLTENIKPDRGDRFILFYGNVNDEFCDDDLVFEDIDFMLWRYFREQGYKRIVFFDGADKITFYDHESRKLCLPGQESDESSRRTGSLKGPLGKRNLLRSKSSTLSSQQQPSASNPSPQGDMSQRQSRMSDLSALEILDFIIRGDDAAVPTVVIFPLAEDIHNFQGASLREIQNRMLKWVKGSRKPHRCVFIFQQSTLDEVKETAQSHELHIVSNFIKEKNEDTSNMIRIGFPDEQETINLIHHYRLQAGLKIDWKILDKVAQLLSKQRLPMKTLNSMFSGIHELNKNTLLEWNKAKSIKSTEYLIQNIEKDSNLLDIPNLKEKMSSVYCQEDNIAQLIDALDVWYEQIEKRSPLTVFLVGTSGVGKTYTAELLAEGLQPLGYEYCYFTMTEFQQEITVSNLIGSPKGYVGSEDEPKLFEALNRSKRLVICFDEIEKAHEKIHKALMQLMEKGFLSWSKGKGDFRECIIFFTSNAQKEKLVKLKSSFIETGKSIDGPDFTNAVRDILVNSQGMPPEVCRRINKFLVYNPLTPEPIIKIAHQEVRKLAKSFNPKMEVIYTAPEFLAEMAVIATGSPYGAAPIKEQVSSKLGKVLKTMKKTLDVKQVIIQKNEEGYRAIPVNVAVTVPSYENMLNEALKIYQKKRSEVSSLDTSKVLERLSQVYCQEDNIAQMVDSLEIWYAQINKKKPLTLFLVGTSGVGKTYTIELLAEALQPLGYEYCYFTMTEFQQKETVSNLIGSPKGYKDSDEEPRLFEALNRSKRLVICFDEIEKAHEKIIKALMQLMDKGFLSWSKGEGDFRECIICFTSNAERERMVDLKAKFRESNKSVQEPDFQEAICEILVKANIAPEVCGRINRFLVYNPLTPEAIINITHQEVKKLALSYNMKIIHTAPEFLAEIAEKTAGSLKGSRIIEEEVKRRLGKTLLSAQKTLSGDTEIAIIKENDNYKAIPANELAQIPSYEEMIESAKKLIFLNDKKGKDTITDSIIKPKRLLHLHELPTSLPEDKISTETNPLNSVLPAVGYVEVKDRDGKEGSGSGFVITPDGKFITSYHVIEDAHLIRVQFDNRPDEWFTAEFIDGDKDADIAILKLAGNNFPYALMAQYGDRVELGESVGLLGYPLGEDLGNRVTYTAGVIGSFRQGTDGTSLYQIDANAYNGNSGGPLFRLRDGRIIGILMGGWKEAVQINFAVSINELYKRLIREY